MNEPMRQIDNPYSRSPIGLGFEAGSEAQMALDQRHEQARVERIIRLIDSVFSEYHLLTTRDILNSPLWQTLKKQEGVME